MNNMGQKSLLEIAYDLVEQSNGGITIEELLDNTLTASGNDINDVELRSALYIDICSSSKFVYIVDKVTNEGKWDLKVRHSLDEYDKDGSKLYSGEDEKSSQDDETSDDFDDEDKDLDDEDDESDDEDDEDDEDSDEESTEDSYDDDGSSDYVDDDSDNLFDEDDYADKMDEYEDLYED